MTTKEWIEYAWAWAAKRSANELQQAENAWQYLKYQRDHGNSQDTELAAAEHYAFARYFSSTSGDLDGVQKNVQYYETLKFLMFAMGKSKAFISTPGKKPSPPTVASIRYGMMGANDGIKYYKTTHGGRDGKRFEAWMLTSDTAAQILNVDRNTIRLPIRALRAVTSPLDWFQMGADSLGGLWGEIKKRFSSGNAGAAALMCAPSSNDQMSVTGKVLS